MIECGVGVCFGRFGGVFGRLTACFGRFDSCFSRLTTRFGRFSDNKNREQ